MDNIKYKTLFVATLLEDSLQVTLLIIMNPLLSNLKNKATTQW